MTREIEEPHQDAFGADVHPAYAMIGASRWSGSPGAVLFGSDFRHRHYVAIRIHEASTRRDLTKDWHHAGKLIAEIVLSEAQWATFVSAMNVGDGVAATLTYRERDGYVPGLPAPVDRRPELRVEIDERLQRALTLLDEIDKDSKVTGPTRRRAQLARQEIVSNLSFVSDSFDKHAEETVERMKIEVNAYMTSVIHRAGLEALGATPPLSLDDGDDRP